MNNALNRNHLSSPDLTSDVEDTRGLLSSPSLMADTDGSRRSRYSGSTSSEDVTSLLYRTAHEARMTKQHIPISSCPIWEQEDCLYNYGFIRISLLAFHLLVLLLVGYFFFLFFDPPAKNDMPYLGAILLFQTKLCAIAVVLWFLIGVAFSRLFDMENPIPQKPRLASGLMSPLVRLASRDSHLTLSPPTDNSNFRRS